MKKALALFIITSLIVCCLASCSIVVDDPGLANDQTYSGEYGGLQWNIDKKGTLTISGEGEIKDFDPDAEDGAWIPHSDKVEKIVINEGVTSIGGNAFMGFAFVTEVTLPETLTQICEYAFSSCESLESITVPKNVSRLEVTAFSNAGGIEEINVDGENEAFSSEDGIVYNKEGSKLILYPMGRDSKSFTVPETVTEIGAYAFNDVDKLEKITFADNVTKIGECAFSGCISLETVKLSESLTVIPTYAFANCIELETVTLPDSLETIEDYAFSFCEKLKEITLSKGVKQIDGLAFENATALEKINVDEANTAYTSVDGVLYSKDKTRLVRMPSACDKESYTVITGTTAINEGAFSCCGNIKNIELPSSITEIGKMAFFECAIRSMKIPNGVTEISTLTFAFCSDLKTVFIPATVTHIEDDAFADAQFETVSFGGTKEQWESCGGDVAISVGIIKFNEKQ